MVQVVTNVTLTTWITMPPAGKLGPKEIYKAIFSFTRIGREFTCCPRQGITQRAIGSLGHHVNSRPIRLKFKVQVQVQSYLPNFHVFRCVAQSPFSPSTIFGMNSNLYICHDDRSLNFLNVGFDKSHLLKHGIDVLHCCTVWLTVTWFRLTQATDNG